MTIKHVEPSDDVPNLQARNQFLHDYGMLSYWWSQFDFFVEVKIQRITGMTPMHASIVLGGLQSKAKLSALYCLLNDLGEVETVAKIKRAIGFVKRNALVHGILGADSDLSKFRFYFRRVGDSYKVHHHAYSADEFLKHMGDFKKLADEAVEALNLELDDLEAYGTAVGFEGLDR